MLCTGRGFSVVTCCLPPKCIRHQDTEHEGEQQEPHQPMLLGIQLFTDGLTLAPACTVQMFQGAARGMPWSLRLSWSQPSEFCRGFAHQRPGMALGCWPPLWHNEPSSAWKSYYIIEMRSFWEITCKNDSLRLPLPNGWMRTKWLPWPLAVLKSPQFHDKYIERTWGIHHTTQKGYVISSKRNL